MRSVCKKKFQMNKRPITGPNKNRQIEKKILEQVAGWGLPTILTMAVIIMDNNFLEITSIFQIDPGIYTIYKHKSHLYNLNLLLLPNY